MTRQMWPHVVSWPTVKLFGYNKIFLHVKVTHTSLKAILDHVKIKLLKNREIFFREIETRKEKKKAEDVTEDGEGGGEGVEAGAVWGLVWQRTGAGRREEEGSSSAALVSPQ